MESEMTNPEGWKPPTLVEILERTKELGAGVSLEHSALCEVLDHIAALEAERDAAKGKLSTAETELRQWREPHDPEAFAAVKEQAQKGGS